jgi:Arc/MetJ-type ribon-helix-helix transcriptional regulator
MDEKETIRAALREVAESRARIADDETAQILAALRAGLGPVEIGRLVERSREHVRKVARAHGIEG